MSQFPTFDEQTDPDALVAKSMESPEDAGKRAVEVVNRAVAEDLTLQEAEGAIAAEAVTPAAGPAKPKDPPPKPSTGFFDLVTGIMFPKRPPMRHLLDTGWAIGTDPVRSAKVLAKGTVETGRRLLEAGPRVAVRSAPAVAGMPGLPSPWPTVEALAPDQAEDVRMKVQEFLEKWQSGGAQQWAVKKAKEWETEHEDWSPAQIESVQQLATNPKILAEHILATAPYMAGTMVASATTGPGGAYFFCYAVEGQSTYEQAMMEIPALHPDWSEEEVREAAEQQAHVVGSIIGAMEALSTGKMLEMVRGKSTIVNRVVGGLLDRLHKAWRVIPVGRVTKHIASLYALEGIQETVESLVESGCATWLYDRPFGLDVLRDAFIEGQVGGFAGIFLGGGATLGFRSPRVMQAMARGRERAMRLHGDQRGEMDLFGTELPPEQHQPELWGERGVEATWRTIRGVEYVLSADGMYAQRADGTGKLISLAPDETLHERLQADAAGSGKGAPLAAAEPSPAPAAEKQPWEMTREGFEESLNAKAAKNQRAGDWHENRILLPDVTEVAQTTAGGGRAGGVWLLQRGNRLKSDAPLKSFGIGLKGRRAALKYAARELHERVVADALSEGHPVPAEVLADYPDLAKLAAAETPARETAADVRQGDTVAAESQPSPAPAAEIAPKSAENAPEIAPEVQSGEPAQAAEKQPWEMTREEFGAYVERRPAVGRANALYKGADSPREIAHEWAHNHVGDWFSDEQLDALEAGALERDKQSAGTLWAATMDIDEAIALLYGYHHGGAADMASRGSPELYRIITSLPAPPTSIHALHASLVQEAVAHNRPVPAEVLADYPDLAKLAPAEPAPAAEVSTEEEVPIEVREAQAPAELSPAQERIQSYMENLDDRELRRALAQMPGPYGGTMTQYGKGAGPGKTDVGIAGKDKALAEAQATLRAKETAAKKALADLRRVYPDAIEAIEAGAAEDYSALGLLGAAKLYYGTIPSGRPVEYATEIAEAIDGLPRKVRQHFTRNPKVKAMTLDDLHSAWCEAHNIPPVYGPSKDTILDQLLSEIEDTARKSDEATLPLEERLGRFADNLPDAERQALREQAKGLGDARSRVWDAQEALLDEAMPYLVDDAMAEPVSAEVEAMEREAARKLAQADQALNRIRQSEVAAERGKATIAEQVAILEKAAALSGVTHITGILRAVRKAASPEALDRARTQLAWALENHVRRKHAIKAARVARRIMAWNRRQKFDPRDADAQSLVTLASISTETHLMSLDLPVLMERERMLAETLHEYQTRDKVEQSDLEEQAATVAETLIGEANANGLGRVDTETGTGRPGLWQRLSRLLHLQYKPVTFIEEIFGTNSAALRLWNEFALGKDDESTGFRSYYRHNRDNDNLIHPRLKDATGFDLDTNPDAYLDWLSTPLSVTLPDAGDVRLTFGEWMGLTNTTQDPDGDMQTASVPLGRAANVAAAPFCPYLSAADRTHLDAALDAADPRLRKAADVYWWWFQQPEHWREATETWHAVKGWWPDERIDYWPLHRDIPRGARELLGARLPGDESDPFDRIIHAIQEINFFQNRTPNATSPLLIKDAHLEYLRHSRMEAALISFAMPAKNIQRVMNFRGVSAEDPTLLGPSVMTRLERAFGRDRARAVWINSVAHVLDTVHLARGGGLQSNGALDDFVEAGMMNYSRYTFVASPFPLWSQLMGGFGKLSDPISSPTTLADYRAGVTDAMDHPVRYGRELVELSPLVRHRIEQAPALFLFGDLREASTKRSLWAIARWYRRGRAQFDKKLFFARHGDALTQVARWRTNLHYLMRQGVPESEAKVQAARMTEVDIENQDFPAHAGAADVLSQQGRHDMGKRFLVWVGQSRSSQANLFIRNYNQFIRRESNPKKFLKSGVGLLMTSIGQGAMWSLRASLWGTGAITVGGVLGKFVAGTLFSLFGNIHGVRTLVSLVQYPWSGLEMVPLAGPIEKLYRGITGIYAAIDEWNDEKAWRASQNIIFSLAALCGIPLAGAKGMYNIVDGIASRLGKGATPTSRTRPTRPARGRSRRPAPGRGRSTSGRARPARGRGR